MGPVGQVSMTVTGTDLTVTDEAGNTYTMHGFGAGKGVMNDIDPRIDLTKPIYEQVFKLRKLDAASVLKLGSRKA